jgi:hypothetical protein
MARIARETYNKKINVALAAFKATPEPAIKTVNTTIFSEFGGYMNLADIYLVREVARQNGTAEDFLTQQKSAKIAAATRKSIKDDNSEIVATPVVNTPVSHHVPDAVVAEAASVVAEAASVVAEAASVVAEAASEGLL